MPKPKTSITFFLWVVTVLLALVFLAVSLTTLRGLAEIAGRSAELRRESLPRVFETQRSFVAIENLRRTAEVAWTADDPELLRQTRLSAQAQAADPSFSRAEDFQSSLRVLIRNISELTRLRERLLASRDRLHELNMEYLLSLNSMGPFIGDTGTMRHIFNAYFDTSLPGVGKSDFLAEETTALEERKADDASKIAFINAVCRRASARRPELSGLCENQLRIIDEVTERRDQLYAEFQAAAHEWRQINLDLRELSDITANDAEFVVSDVLSGIESTSRRALMADQIITGIGICFFLAYFFIMHWNIVRPIRWTGRKLYDLQRGVVEGPPPPAIHIAEMHDMAQLLERFSDKLAEMTSQASQLAEDAEGKKDLESLMSAVFRLSLDGYSVWSPEKIYTISEGFKRLFKVDDLDELARRWPDLLLPDREDLLEFYRKTLAEGFWRREMVLRDAHGDPLPCEITYVPVTWEGQTRVLSYFRDLRVQKRTERELRAAKDQALEAARVKSDFLARMSHEIRTPMNGVLGLTHLALQNDPPEKQRVYLEKIQASARILLGVINDILDFSKLESGRFTLENRRFSFPAMLSVISGLFTAQAEEKKLYFRLEVDESIPAFVMGDELRISQVLLNLCGNAVKFTAGGGVILRINLLEEKDDLLTLRFQVIDSGPGMTQSQLQGLFRPFTQADTSTTRKFGGTGLGLVIAKLLTELMGGALEVSSAPGQGSVFSFDLPLRKAGGPAEAAAADESEPGGASLRGLRVLLVEDNLINQEIGKALLEDLGLLVFVASNGLEALDFLRENRVDGVLMDIQMPLMDGLTAAGHIRKDDREWVRHLPVIAMTAHAMAEDRRKSLEAGMNDHINKPIDVDELRAKLRRWLTPRP